VILPLSPLDHQRILLAVTVRTSSSGGLRTLRDLNPPLDALLRG